jgi:hypothetical protein
VDTGRGCSRSSPASGSCCPATTLRTSERAEREPCRAGVVDGARFQPATADPRWSGPASTWSRARWSCTTTSLASVRRRAAVRAYGRVLAARRAALERWSPSRRIAYAAWWARCLPRCSLWRLARRRARRRCYSAYLPVVLLSYAKRRGRRMPRLPAGEGDAEALYKRIDFESQRDGLRPLRAS